MRPVGGPTDSPGLRLTFAPPHPEFIISQSCPACGEKIVADARFVVWCMACDWNLSPDAAELGAGPSGPEVDSKLAVLLDGRQRELFDQVQSHGADAATLSRAATTGPGLLDAAVLASSAAVVAAFGFLAATTPMNAIGVFYVIGVVAFVMLLRPRFGWLPRGTSALNRHDAPALFELLDAISSSLGTRRVARVVIDDTFESSLAVRGLGFRRVLHIGGPLWVLLDPAERVALLARALARDVVGDPDLRPLRAASAKMLVEWHAMLGQGRPQLTYPTTSILWVTRMSAQSMGLGSVGMGRGFVSIAGAMLRLASRPVGRLVRLRQLWSIETFQRSQYRADRAAARVAGVSGLLGVLDKQATRNACLRALRTAVREGLLASSLWDYERAVLGRLPDLERERMRRLEPSRRSLSDHFAPPVQMRRRALAGLPGPHSAEPVKIVGASFAAIDAEVSAPLARVADRLVDGLPASSY
jgi:hypothetical protein